MKRNFACLFFPFFFLCLATFLPRPVVAELGFGSKWEASSFCKCICFQNYTILPLSEPENPSKPCLSCTKQWCLDKKLDICVDASLGDINPDTATGKEGDVEARCFKRDSPRDQLVVTLFLLTVFGLLVGAGIKSQMDKAGINLDTNMAWDAARAGRRWWENMLPARQVEFNLGALPWSSSRRRERGEYRGVATAA
ncbi:hypothetical protein M422DRAFT_236822 [Sphaerobolus stellatus SS14]|uniref:Uncharacterized protein n=1 Tax=Sphaerobolus stellatus (strain SS14) TaxID=990650 RepID=A0A0C9UKG1_SPHS4|nr:hypothetical protein M422DRAFT_236822 [Sphaerobolus stellatus SS14]